MAFAGFRSRFFGTSSALSGPPWQRLHVALAALNILMVVVSLSFNHRIMEIYRSSVAENMKWAQRLRQYQDFRRLAADVNAPGTDAFESSDPNVDRLALRNAQQIFAQQVHAARQDLAADSLATGAPDLRRELDKVELAVREMSNRSQKVIQFVATEQDEDATRELIQMDRQMTLVQAAIGELMNCARRIQESQFDSQFTAARSQYVSHEIISLSNLAIVMCVTVFGFRLTRRVHSAEAQQREILATLFENEERTRLVLDNALDGVVSLDADGRITGWNKQAEKTFGWSSEDVLGKTLRGTIIPSLAYSTQDKALQRWLETGQSHILNRRIEVTAMHSNGTQFPIELAITPVEQGRQVTFSVFLRDITERKRWEEDLRQAQHVAESAARTKSEFLANMSHEIRTPMTSIIGFADVLMEPKQPTGERLRHAKTIKRNAQHLLNILNDILDVSKLDAGKLRVEKIPCSPLEIVEEVAALMKLQAEEKDLQFDVQCFFPLPESIPSDPTRLRQILLNLLGNAIKFTELGNVRIEVRCELPEGLQPCLTVPDAKSIQRPAWPVTHKQPCLTISVIDTGVGLTQEQIGGLFHPFQQADNSTTRLFGGTGLGLTISQRLARLMGGHILVESEYGVGSCFTLRLPIGDLAGVKMLDRLSDSGELSLAAGHSVATVSWNGRVLVAEDGRDNRRLISAFLEKTGVTVQFASNGRIACDQALEAVANGQPFDLILMDMQMPEMDGYAATSHLRRLGYRGKIVAVTAHAMTGDRQKCLDAGCDEYLTKPFRREDFIEKIGQFLRVAEPPASNHDDSISAPRGSTSPADNSGRPLLRSHFADDPVIGAIVGDFVAGIPEKLDEIKLAFQASDSMRLRFVVHQLKGAAGGYGFPEISDAARTLELLIDSSAAPHELQIAINSLIDLCERAALSDGALATA
ncbi:MAG: response regulator [Planctomycetales bacterium]|nr:response regulator [Planctomycetales bacterium]